MNKFTPRNSWTTRDGRTLLIEDMDDQHLVNTIKFIRRGAILRLYRELLTMEIYMEDAPDGARAACEMESKRLEQMTDDEYITLKVKSFPKMLKEAKKRKLDI